MKYNFKFKNAKIEKLAKGFRLCRRMEGMEGADGPRFV